MVERLFLLVPWGCLRFVIVVFPNYTHLLFLYSFFDCYRLSIQSANNNTSSYTRSKWVLILLRFIKLGDNCIQNFNLRRHIVGYAVRNLVLWWHVSRAIKRDFGTYILRYTSPNENFNYDYPHSNALLTFSLKITLWKCTLFLPTTSDCQLHIFTCDVLNQWKATLCNDVGFATVYGKIFCHIFMTLSNQMSSWLCKCIRMHDMFIS